MTRKHDAVAGSFPAPSPAAPAPAVAIDAAVVAVAATAAAASAVKTAAKKAAAAPPIQPPPSQTPSSAPKPTAAATGTKAGKKSRGGSRKTKNKAAKPTTKPTTMTTRSGRGRRGAVPTLNPADLPSSLESTALAPPARQTAYVVETLGGAEGGAPMISLVGKRLGTEWVFGNGPDQTQMEAKKLYKKGELSEREIEEDFVKMGIWRRGGDGKGAKRGREEGEGAKGSSKRPRRG